MIHGTLDAGGKFCSAPDAAVAPWVGASEAWYNVTLSQLNQYLSENMLMLINARVSFDVYFAYQQSVPYHNINV